MRSPRRLAAIAWSLAACGGVATTGDTSRAPSALAPPATVAPASNPLLAGEPAPAPTPAPNPTLTGEIYEVEESPRDRHVGRMLAESSALFATMSASYWKDRDANQEDFEYDADWRNLRERFVTLEGWALDDNAFETNAWRHPAQGALTYLFARSNGLSAVQAYAMALGFSGAWELLGEYKEQVSINDLIVTPLSGYVIGEAFWHLGVFFLRGEPSWSKQIAGNVFSGGKGVLDRLDHKRPWRARRVDGLGFDRTLGHAFKIYAGAGTQQATGGGAPQQLLRAGLDSELTMIPAFDEPGRSSRFYKRGGSSRIRVESTWTEHGLTDFRALVRTGVITWHRKDLSRATGDGYNLLYGFASAYEYGFHRSQDRDSAETKDLLAIGHLGGVMVDLALARDGFRIRSTLDAYGDFAFVRNYAIDAYRAANPEAEVRSTIRRYNYHHAVGVTGSGRLVASYGLLEAGLEVQLDWFESIQGLDRRQATIVDDYALFDFRREGRLWAGYGLALTDELTLKLELGFEARARGGAVKTTRQEAHERRYLGGAQLEF